MRRHVRRKGRSRRPAPPPPYADVVGWSGAAALKVASASEALRATSGGTDGKLDGKEPKCVCGARPVVPPPSSRGVRAGGRGRDRPED